MSAIRESIESIIKKIKLKKISPWIINILRMGIYQIIFLDKIPKSAAVNESVNLAKRYGHASSSNFVNAILRKIEKNDYEELMREFEFRKFKSPAGWMLVLNYYRIVHYLNQAHYYLSQYQEIMKGKNEIRLSLTYNHFNKEHIFVSDETLISIDRMKINYCIYDLIDIFQNHDELYDSLPLLEYYLKEVKLLKEEKILMQCILSIVPQVQLNLQEEVNIYQMSKLICYLDGLQEIFKKLMIDEK